MTNCTLNQNYYLLPARAYASIRLRTGNSKGCRPTDVPTGGMVFGMDESTFGI